MWTEKHEAAVQDARCWHDNDQLAEKDDSGEKLTETEGVVTPIMMKVCQTDSRKPNLKKVTFDTDETGNLNVSTQDIAFDDHRFAIVHDLVDEVLLSLRVPVRSLDIDDANAIADIIHKKAIGAFEIPSSMQDVFLQQIRRIVYGKLGLVSQNG